MVKRQSEREQAGGGKLKQEVAKGEEKRNTRLRGENLSMKKESVRLRRGSFSMK